MTDGASDEYGEYEEEWEASDAESQCDGGEVHPMPVVLALPHAPVKTMSHSFRYDDQKSNLAKPTRYHAHGKDENIDSPVKNVKLGKVYTKEAPIREVVNRDDSDLAAKHAMRRLLSDSIRDTSHSIGPPPAPLAKNQVDIGSRAAAEASLRVQEFRRTQEERARQLEAEKAAADHLRKQVRMQNKPFNRSIGIADVSPQQRLQELSKERKTQRRIADKAATDDRSNRWYNNVQRPSRRQLTSTVDGATLLRQAKEQHRARLQEKARHREMIARKLQQLNKTTKSLVAKSAGEYVRGSYILKVPVKKQADGGHKQQQ